MYGVDRAAGKVPDDSVGLVRGRAFGQFNGSSRHGVVPMSSGQREDVIRTGANFLHCAVLTASGQPASMSGELASPHTGLLSANRRQFKSLAALLICAVFLLPADPRPASAQGVDLEFRHMYQDDGLSSPDILCVLQDRYGFLWIGTTNGLNRFDGVDFSIYRALPVDTTSLPGNIIYSITEAPSGTLWIGTDNGLARYDYATDSFVTLPSDGLSVSAVLEDDDGSVWIGTFDGGLHHISDDSTRSLSPYPDNEYWVINALFEDPAGTTWVGSIDGLFRLDRSAKTLTREVAIPGDQQEAGGIDHILNISVDPDDPGLLLLSGAQGLAHFRPATGEHHRIITFPFSPGVIESEGVWWSMPQSVARDVGDNRVVWTVNPQLGLIRVNVDTGAYQVYPSTDGSSAGPAGSARCIYRDRTDLLWVCTEQALSRADPHRWPVGLIPGPSDLVRTSMVSGIAVESDSVLWITTGDGLASPTLSRLDVASESAEHWLGDREQIGYSTDQSFGYMVFKMTRARDGRVLLATAGNGLVTFDPASEAFNEYKYSDTDPGSLAGDVVQSVFQDSRETIWVGSAESGLSRLDRNASSFVRYAPIGMSPSDFEPLALLEDSRGRLWIGTMRGLYVLERERDEVLPVRLGGAGRPGTVERSTPSDGPLVNTLAISPGAPDVLWIGTDDGLFRLPISSDPADARGEYLGNERSVLSYPVASILADDYGFLWIGTSAHGVYRYNPAAGDVGLLPATRGRTFWYESAARAPSGRLYFGGRDGLTWLDPDEERLESPPPPIAITNFTLFGRSVFPGPDSPLERSPLDTDEIKLAHDQNSIGFSFSGFDYRDSAQNRYAYKLDGLQDAWVDNGTRRTATFTNLDPGRYVFHVRATNSAGVASDEVAVVVNIAPPWWRTVWAYLAYLFILVAAVVSVSRVQRQRVLRRERERTRQRELEQAREIERAYHQLQETQQQLIQSEKLASLGQVTAGIAHEIKNPLNFINNFAELNEELAAELRESLASLPGAEGVSDVLDDMEENARLIAEHGKRADGIVRSMMQHASGGEGIRERVDINRLVEEHVDLAFHARRAQVSDWSVDLVKAFGSGLPEVEIVPREVGRVVLNLLVNAFDAVQEKMDSGDGDYSPRVVVTTATTTDGVQISVEDNGPGIAPGVMDKVFEAFFTTKDPGKGTGLGLSLSYEIVTRGHQGTMTVEPAAEGGCRFVVNLPA